jgi:hypothetical protein
LFLDAQSAFDVVQRELLIKNLFFCVTSDPSVYIDKQLKSRTTFLDWDKSIMGPLLMREVWSREV